MRNSIEEYSKFVEEMWRSKEPGSLKDDYVMTSGLGGETGEVLELLKKRVRDGIDNDFRFTLRLAEELGDVLYYTIKIANRFGLSIDDLIDVNKEKLNNRAAFKAKVAGLTS